MFKKSIAFLLAAGLLAPAAAQADWVEPSERVVVGIKVSGHQKTDWQYDDEFDDSCSTNRIHVSGEGSESLNFGSKGEHVTELTYFPDGTVKFDTFNDELKLFGRGTAWRVSKQKITVIGDDEPKCGGGAEPSKPLVKDCGLKTFKLLLRLKIPAAEQYPILANPYDNGADPYRNCTLFGAWGGTKLLDGGPTNYTVDPEDESHVTIVGRNRDTRELGLKGTAITTITWRIDITARPDSEQPGGEHPDNGAEDPEGLTASDIAEGLGAAPAPAVDAAAASRAAEARARALRARRAEEQRAVRALARAKGLTLRG